MRGKSDECYECYEGAQLNLYDSCTCCDAWLCASLHLFWSLSDKRGHGGPY